MRALSIANGQLLGPRVPYRNAAETSSQVAFAAHDTRGVRVPAVMSPPGFQCLSGHRDRAACVEATATGDYYPLPYLLPAVAIRAAGSASTGLWLARIASVLPCALMLVLAVLLLWDQSALSVIGLSASLTPMVFFTASVVNPSGLEICASLSLAAASLRIARENGASPRWVWVVLAGSGATVLLSFQAGPAFAIFDLLLGFGLLGWSRARQLCVSNRYRSIAAGSVLLVAAFAWLVYSQSSGIAHAQFGVSPVVQSLKAAIAQMHVVLYEAIGVFGALSVALPAAVRLPWLLVVLSLVIGAGMLATARERVVLAATICVAFAFPVLANAWIYRHSGFALQARQVMPVLLLVPLLAGEIVYRNRRRLRMRSVLTAEVGGLGLLAALEFAAWVVNAHDATGAQGTAMADQHPVWNPPLGWTLWTLMAAAGAASIFVAALVRPRPVTESLAVAPRLQG